MSPSPCYHLRIIQANRLSGTIPNNLWSAQNMMTMYVWWPLAPHFYYFSSFPCVQITAWSGMPLATDRHEHFWIQLTITLRPPRGATTLDTSEATALVVPLRQAWGIWRLWNHCECSDHLRCRQMQCHSGIFMEIEIFWKIVVGRE